MSVATAHGRPSVNSPLGFCLSPVSLITPQGFLHWVLFLIPTPSLGQWLRSLTPLSLNTSHLRTYHSCLTDASHTVNAPKVLSERMNAQPLNLLRDYVPSPNPKLQSHCYFSLSMCDLFLPLAPLLLPCPVDCFSPRFLDSMKGNTILCFLFIWSCPKPCNGSSGVRDKIFRCWGWRDALFLTVFEASRLRTLNQCWFIFILSLS